MSKELTEQLKNKTLKEGLYWCEITESPYVEQVHLPCYDDIVVEVLAPVPTYAQFSQLVKKVEELKQQLEYAERTIKNIRILMSCDPSDMKEIDENFCADQQALETVNGYFEKYGVEK